MELFDHAVGWILAIAIGADLALDVAVRVPLDHTIAGLSERDLAAALAGGKPRLPGTDRRAAFVGGASARGTVREVLLDLAVGLAVDVDPLAGDRAVGVEPALGTGLRAVREHQRSPWLARARKVLGH